jgi:hypothetical protein
MKMAVLDIQIFEKETIVGVNTFLQSLEDDEALNLKVSDKIICDGDILQSLARARNVE